MDSGLVYARDRYLASDTGRWTQVDRLGFDAGPNFFAYVGGRPTRLVDPSGQLPFLMLPVFGAAIGGIFGLLGGLAQGGLSTGQLVQEFISGAMLGAAATIDVIGKLVPWVKAPIITGAITNALFAALGNVAAQVIATGSVQSWPSVIISALFAAGATMLMGMSRFGLRDAARMMSSDLQLPFTVRDMFTLIPAKGAAMFDFMVQALLVPAFYYQEQSAKIDAMFREGDLACLPG